MLRTDSNTNTNTTNNTTNAATNAATNANTDDTNTSNTNTNTNTTTNTATTTDTNNTNITTNTNTSNNILSAHVQPGLEEGDPPLTLVWVIRPSPNPGKPYDVNDVGKKVVAAYYQSLRDEGFPEENISLAERIVEGRCRGRVFHLMPLAEVPDLRDHVYEDEDKKTVR
jgi:hypothetical protein